MNTFIDEFIARLKSIESYDDIETDICNWLWDHKDDEVPETAHAINTALGLAGKYELKPDLPTLAVGSLKGVVVVAANPGWDASRNDVENEYCRESKENYADMMSNFFSTYPHEVGGTSPWWTKAMKFIGLLPGIREIDGNGVGGWGLYTMMKELPIATRWNIAHNSGLLGGWDLFPWHSESDGVTEQLDNHPWLREFCSASIKALLKLEPELLLFASSAGFTLVRDGLIDSVGWIDFVLGEDTKRPVLGCYGVSSGSSEILAMKVQFLGNGFRGYKDEELFSKLLELRAVGSVAS